MWEKIVLNLLSNAFKFTFEGGDRGAARGAGGARELPCATPASASRPTSCRALRALPPRGGRARRARTRAPASGSRWCSELVRLHGGTVAVESELGRGHARSSSTSRSATAHLPADQLATAPPAASTRARAPRHYVEEALRWLPSGRGDGAGATAELRRAGGPRAPTPGRRPRVLLVDDNADMREYLARLLGAQVRVEAVGDGEAALARRARAAARPRARRRDDAGARRLRAAARRCARTTRTRAMPVILLSARAGEEARVEGLEAGADDYLVKPFSARELLARVRAHLALARLRRETAAQLADANHARAEASQAKGAFLANM